MIFRRSGLGRIARRIGGRLPAASRRAARIVILLATCAAAQAACTGAAPSLEDRTTTTDLRGDAVRALEDYAFTLAGRDEERIGIRTDSVLIARGGVIIYEKYARGWEASRPHLLWSVSKSVTAAVLGAALLRGHLSLDDSVCKHLAWLSGQHCAMTVRHLWEFGSGLDWNELYEEQGNQASSVLAMFYGVGHRDTARFVAGHPLRDRPGETWMYSTGDSQLLMAVVQAALPEPERSRFPWRALFEPLGIASAAWERDSAGAILGGSHLYMTPRDLARIGLLHLHGGCWGAARVLPESWTSEITELAPGLTKKAYRFKLPYVSGRHWWVNRPVPGLAPAPFPRLPSDLFYAAGHWGQFLAVVPSLDLVVVRTGDDRSEGFDLQDFMLRAIAVARP